MIYHRETITGSMGKKVRIERLCVYIVAVLSLFSFFFASNAVEAYVPGDTITHGTSHSYNNSTYSIYGSYYVGVAIHKNRNRELSCRLHRRVSGNLTILYIFCAGMQLHLFKLGSLPTQWYADTNSKFYIPVGMCRDTRNIPVLYVCCGGRIRRPFSRHALLNACAIQLGCDTRCFVSKRIQL